MSRLRASSRVVLAGCGAVLALASPQVRAQAVPDVVGEQIRAILKNTREAVVRVDAMDAHGPLVGTGFFIDPNGLLYTSYSVGGEARGIVVTCGAKKYPATRLAADPRSGVALLKVEAETSFLPLGRSSNLLVGSLVVSVGPPRPGPQSPSLGCVSGFDLRSRDKMFVTALIRASVPVMRGEMGAPLLNPAGEAVGILISSAEKGPGSLALPIEAAEKVRADFMRYGEVRPGWLGIQVGEAPGGEGESRVAVQGVIAGAPAEGSGLVRGDRLLAVGGRKVLTAEDVWSSSFYLTAGDTVPVLVERGGETMTIEMEAGDHPIAARRGKLTGAPNFNGLPLEMQK